MDNRSYSQLQELIPRLSAKECWTVTKFLEGFAPGNKRGEKNTLLELFRKLKKDPSLPEKEFKQKHFPNTTEKSLHQYFWRLITRIQETLLLKLNTADPNLYPKKSQAIVQCNKDILLARIFITKGAYDNMFSLLRKTMDQARSYELFDELLDALYLLRKTEGKKHGLKEYEKYTKEIDFYEYCRNSLTISWDYIERFYLEYDTFKGMNNKNIGMTTKALSDMQERFEKTGSAEIGRLYYKLLSEYYNSIEEYDKCCEANISLIKLLFNNKAVRNEKFIANAFRDLADNSILARKIDFPWSFFEIPNQVYQKNTFDYFQLKEVELQKLLYIGESDKGLSLSRSILHEAKEENFPFIYNKFRFYEGVSFFLEGEFKLAIKSMNLTRKIQEDKEGWNIWVRILSIMAEIELFQYDLADHNIEALRKHLYRLGKQDLRIFPREQLIFQVLTALEQSSFDFEEVQDSHDQLLKLLNSNDPDYKWEPKTPELVIFPDWFEAKRKGEEYHFKFPDENTDLELGDLETENFPMPAL